MFCKQNVIILLQLFFLNFSFAQNTLTRTVINQYIDYVNHCNTYISAAHYSVKDYNLKLLRNFRRPEYFHPSNDLFELECQPGSIACSEQLNTEKIKTVYTLLRKSMATLDVPTQNALSKPLNKFHKIFTQLVTQLEVFEAKKFDEKYFLDVSNVKLMEQDLQIFKNTIAQLDQEMQSISKHCTKLFNESSLPPPLERTKQLTLQIKSIIQDFNTKKPVEITSQLQTLQKLINHSDHISGLERMQNFGDFDYIDNPQTQERANIERYTQSTVKVANKLLDNCNCDTPFKFGINTYEQVLNPEIHQAVFKIERLSIFFNDNTGQSVVRNYNKYIERANQPVLKMIGVVLPFEIIQIEIPKEPEAKIVEEHIEDTIVKREANPIFEKENINTLAGAKINNLVLLLDISTSMKREGKMDNLKTAISYLIDLLRPEDVLTIIIYAADSKVLFSSKGETYSKAELKEKINALKSGGGTNIKDALAKAYQNCNHTFIPNGNNKIIIATDGFFDLEEKEKVLIKNNNITLSTFHFKSKKIQKKDAKNLKKMAKFGNGGYTVIEAKDNAIKALIMEAKEDR